MQVAIIWVGCVGNAERYAGSMGTLSYTGVLGQILFRLDLKKIRIKKLGFRYKE